MRFAHCAKVAACQINEQKKERKNNNAFKLKAVNTMATIKTTNSAFNYELLLWKTKKQMMMKMLGILCLHKNRFTFIVYILRTSIFVNNNKWVFLNIIYKTGYGRKRTILLKQPALKLDRSKFKVTDMICVFTIGNAGLKNQ